MTDLSPDHLPDPAAGGTGIAPSLDRMEAINRRLGEIGSRGGEGSGAEIVSLRYDFASECGTFLLALCDDARIFAQRDLFDDLQTALDTLRARVTNHQLRWQGDRIEVDRLGYREASGHLNDAVKGFIAHCRAAIAN